MASENKVTEVLVSAAARELGVSACAIRYWFDRGRLRGRLVGGMRLIEMESVRELARARTAREAK